MNKIKIGYLVGEDILWEVIVCIYIREKMNRFYYNNEFYLIWKLLLVIGNIKMFGLK